MLSAFLHVVSALLGKIVLNRWNKWDDSRIAKEQKAHEYKKSVVITKTLGIAGAVFFAVLLGFGILGLAIWADDRTDWDSFASGILLLLFSLLGVYFILMWRNYRIFYTDSFLEKHSTFGKKRVYAWADLREVRKRGQVYTLVFPAGNVRIYHTKEYIGADALIDFLHTQFF